MGGCSSQSVARWLAVAVLGVLVACSGGSGGGDRTSSPTTAAPTSAPPATIDLSRPIPGGSLHGTPRPPLENTGTDYVAIFKSLTAKFRWLTENPNPDRPTELYVPGTSQHDAARYVPINTWSTNGYRWADEGYQLSRVESWTRVTKRSHYESPSNLDV